MNLRGIHLRAILIPLSVAAMLIIGILWYRLFWIPGQQQYLNERNSRILQTIAKQIATKVDYFDQSIDNAMDAFWPDSDENPKAGHEEDFDLRVQKFKTFVALFTKDLEVTSGIQKSRLPKETPEQEESHVVKFPGDPPRVVIRRDEGTNFLYLGYSHDGHKAAEPVIEAQSNIEKVVRPFIKSRNEFEALVLTDRSGRTIAQYSAKGLRLERVDGLDFSVTAQSSPQAPKPTFEGVRNSGKVASVVIGDVVYKFYAQPVVLSLMVDKKESTQPEEWTLCGLVRADRFGAASMAISPNYWLLFVLALLAICLGVPILKVHVLKPRERFHRSDGALVATTTFLLAGLIGMGAFDAYYFGYRFKTNNDEQLRLVSDKMASNLEHETMDIRSQVDSFRSSPDIDNQSENLPEVKLDVTTSGKFSCTPEGACRNNLLAAVDWAKYPYPYFDLVSWSDKKGTQRNKWSTSNGLTPFINLRLAKVSYFDALERANLLNPGTAAPVDVGMAVLPSPNTGNNITVLWEALGNSPLSGISLTLSAPISVSNPVLPRSVQFAVIDANGLVIYHSDQTRSLKENFFQETENNSHLRAAIQGRDSLPLTTQYLGLRQRLIVKPLELAGPGKPLTQDPGWSLVVFQPVDVPDTVNLEALTMTGAIFALYSLLIGTLWLLAVVIAPGRAKKWFWPDRAKALAYRNVAFLNLGLSIAFLAFATHRSPAGTVTGGITLALIGVAASFAILTRQPKFSRADVPTWQRDFFVARLSFLFIAAAVPAMAFFQASFALETDVLLRRGKLQADAQLNARMERIQKDAQKLKLCGKDNEPCGETIKYLERRIGGHYDSYDTSEAPLFFESTLTPFPNGRTNPDPETGWLDRFLAAMYFPFNDEAENLRSALLGLSPSDWGTGLYHKNQVAHAVIGGLEIPPLQLTSTLQNIQEDAVYGIVALVAAAGIVLLLRFGVMPMYLASLCSRPGRKVARTECAEGNLLIVGPPGEEKTAMLKSNPGLHIFDVGTELFDPASSTKHELVGLDHFERGLDEAKLRGEILAFLECLTYRQHQVWIATTRDPLDQLNELSAEHMERWSAVFQSFRKERVGLGIAEAAQKKLAELRAKPIPGTTPLYDLVLKECSISPQLLKIGNDVLRESLSDDSITEEELLVNIGVAAEPYYRALWTACSGDEKLALRQLAEESVVNPRNGIVIARLLRSGLIRRDPTFRVMNESFRRFALEMLSADELSKEERKGLDTSWSTYALSFATMAAALTAVLFLTQQQLLDTWVGYVPMIVPVVTTAGKMFAGGQRPGKPTAGVA